MYTGRSFILNGWGMDYLAWLWAWAFEHLSSIYVQWVQFSLERVGHGLFRMALGAQVIVLSWVPHIF